MKLLLILLLACQTVCIAQPVTLYNTWKSESKTIYVGVTNLLLIKGDTKSIKSIIATGASIIQKQDSLIVKPFTTKDVKILIETKHGKISNQYYCNRLPYPTLQVVDINGLFTAPVTKQSILKSNYFRVISQNDTTEKLFEDYYIAGLSLKINLETYDIDGNILSEQVRRVIAGLESGSKIIVKRLKMKNSVTGKELNMVSNQTLFIL
jgi:hypothetical protein